MKMLTIVERSDKKVKGIKADTVCPAEVGVSTMLSGSEALVPHCEGTAPKTRSNLPVDANVRIDMDELHTPSGAL